MHHDILKEVIFDQHEIIKKTNIVPRDYDFDLNANYGVIIKSCGLAKIA